MTTIISTHDTFDDNWNKLDTASRGFIYGRDLPSLVAGASRLDSSGLRIIEKFSEEQPFYKLYRSVISGVLKNLVGMSVEEMGFVGGNDDVENGGGNAKTNEHEHHDREKPDKIESRKQGLPSGGTPVEAGTTAISDEIERLQGIIQEKDALIELKNEELADVTRELKLYKEKFKYIVREFTFYRQNADMKRSDATAADGHYTNTNGLDGTKPKIKADLRIEFFKNEFKRQLEEQAAIIKELRRRLRKESSLANTQFFGDSSSSSSSFKSSTDPTDSKSGREHALNIPGIPFWPLFTKSTTTVIIATVSAFLVIPLILGLISQLSARTSLQDQQSSQSNGSNEYAEDKLLVFPPFIENSPIAADHLLLYEEQENTHTVREREVSPLRRLGSFILQILGIKGDPNAVPNYFAADYDNMARGGLDQGRLDAYNQIFGLL